MMLSCYQCSSGLLSFAEGRHAGRYPNHGKRYKAAALLPVAFRHCQVLYHQVSFTHLTLLSWTGNLEKWMLEEDHHKKSHGNPTACRIHLSGATSQAAESWNHVQGCADPSDTALRQLQVQLYLPRKLIPLHFQGRLKCSLCICQDQCS